jgi:hypothetical protein
MRAFGPLASMTSLKKGSVFLGTTPRGQTARGLDEGGYHETTEVIKYSEMMLSTKF